MKKSARANLPIEDVYTSKWYNQQLKTPAVRPAPTTIPPAVNPIVVEVINASLTKNRFDPIGISGPSVTADDDIAHGSVVCNATTTFTSDLFGVLQGPLNDGTAAKAIFRGLTWARFAYNDDAHEFVEVSSGTLVSAETGPARIIYPPPGTAPVTGVGLIFIDGPTTESTPGSGDPVILVQFTLTATLAAGIGSTAAATVTNGYGTGAPTSGSITVVNTGNAVSYSTCKGLAMKVGSNYYVLDIEQRAQSILGTAAGAVTQFTGATLSNPTARSQWPYTYLPTVDNEGTPQISISNTYDFKATTGDKILAEWDHANNRYEVVDVYPTIAKRWSFRFITEWPLGLTQTGSSTNILPLTVAHGHKGRVPVSGEISVTDRFNKAHNAGTALSSFIADSGIAEWCEDRGDGVGEFQIVECTHKATHCRGTITSNATGTPATFSVTVAQNGLMDGRHPNKITSGTGTITVQNAYDWPAVTAGYKIEIRRDPHDGLWYPVQMKYECPA